VVTVVGGRGVRFETHQIARPRIATPATILVTREPEPVRWGIRTAGFAAGFRRFDIVGDPDTRCNTGQWVSLEADGARGKSSLYLRSGSTLR